MEEITMKIRTRWSNKRTLGGQQIAFLKPLEKRA
ncbi:hypothetical protein CCACVL1_19072 [Corchorus capsularis]|uniref:Uncharacterized protein n=1 Tax=Corchorus capsularis TaxID=210143 RepID=A0A1R3HIQ4_COCAP|nr:hypothetical protein CCACVL1_19072 [Corchorus capsularis]